MSFPSVLFLSQYTPFQNGVGGAANSFWYLANTYAETCDGDKCTILKSNEASELATEINRLEGDAHSFPVVKKICDSLDLTHVVLCGFVDLQYYSYFKSRDIKILLQIRHPNTYPTLWYDRLRYKRCWARWRSFFWLRKLRACSKLADALIVPSNHAKQKLSQNFAIRNRDKIHVLHNAIMEDIFRFEKSETSVCRNRVICAARLNNGKGIEDIIESFRYVVDANPSAELHIAGDGDHREELEKLVADKAIPNVCFHGYLSQHALADLYRSGRVFVNASRSESFGNVIYEAMACGLPVVAYKLEVFTEILTGNDDITFVTLGDKKGLGSSILKLLNDDHFYESRRQNSKRKIQESLSWEKSASELCCIIAAHSAL